MSSIPNTKPHDTVAQLKADIDSGRTGDKVANADPGLSPLGTDDEAGGNPMTPEQITLARRTEAKAFEPVSDTRRATWVGWLLPAVIALIAGGALVVYLMHR